MISETKAFILLRQGEELQINKEDHNRRKPLVVLASVLISKTNQPPYKTFTHVVKSTTS